MPDQTPDTSTPRDTLLSFGFDLARNAIERGDSPTLYTATGDDTTPGNITVTTNQGRIGLLAIAVALVLVFVLIRK